MTKLTLFPQRTSKLDTLRFMKLAKIHQTDKHQKGFESKPHLISMLFCQFSKSQYLLSVSNSLRSKTDNLNH